MSNSHSTEPTFKDRSDPEKDIAVLERALGVPNPTTAELLGVLAFNIRHAGGSHIFDIPIPIDSYDQRRLLEFGLVKRIQRSVSAVHDLPVAALTDFGEFVVSRAVLVDSSANHMSIPRIDAEALLEQLS